MAHGWQLGARGLDPVRPARLRALALVVLLLSLGGSTHDGGAATPEVSDGGTIRGADISFTPQMEAIGTTYRGADGGAHPLERLLADAGATHIRVRVWVDPPPGYSDLPAALALAARAHEAGLDVVLSLHYSDFWADERHQRPPAAWAGQDVAALEQTVRAYTRDVVAAFAAQGTPVDLVQIGNEVTLGMLRPQGQVFDEQGGESWDDFVTLLRAGVAGAREGSPPDHPVRVVLHINRGGDLGATVWFYDNVLSRGVHFDVIGITYYPHWDGALRSLRQTMNGLADRYGKDVLVVETAYPWTLRQGDPLDNEVSALDELPESDTFPPTPQGQAAFYEALRAVVAGVPGGHGAGFLVWEPGWLPGVGWEAGAGNQYENMTMFDWSGNALPSLRAFRP